VEGVKPEEGVWEVIVQLQLFLQIALEHSLLELLYKSVVHKNDACNDVVVDIPQKDHHLL
jgi:hypothetical protein